MYGHALVMVSCHTLHLLVGPTCFHSGRGCVCPLSPLQRAPRNKFPLYTEAIKHALHENRMVRIAVRAITLSVYKSTCYGRILGLVGAG